MKTTTLLFLLATILTVRAERAGATSDADSSSARLTLAEVARAVCERNPAIREALRKWEAAKHRIIQEGAWDDLKVASTSKVRRYVDVPPESFTDQMLSIE